MVVSPYVLAELDYLITERAGVAAELSALSELRSGVWEHAQLAADDIRAARNVISQYHDQEIGLTDASLVVLAARYRTNRILTLDHRHFQVLRTLDGDPFLLLPA